MLATASLFAQTSRPKLPGEDWVPLFNGKDLTGWTNVGNQKWVVEDGTIHGLAVTKDYGYLRTQKNYKDFQLSLQFKCEGEGNSGVFFHVDFKPGTADVVQGPQFEIDCHLGQHTGGVYDVGRQWIVWPAPENEIVVRRDEWNEYLLKVVGQPLRVAVERNRDGRLHGSEAVRAGRRHCTAVTRGRPGQHAVQRNLRSRSDEALIRDPRVANAVLLRPLRFPAARGA